MLKKGGQLLFGNDLRDNLPLPDPDTYLAALTGRAYAFTGWFRPDINFESPLSYPDSNSEFFGYEYKRIAGWYPPEIEYGTKELVAEVGWITSAIIGIKLGCIVGLKEEAVNTYVNQIGGDYADLIWNIYQKCKLEWGYLIPTVPQDRALLRHLCTQMPDFENYFLRIYNEYREQSSLKSQPV
jgi:hypothetical protein